MKSKTLTLILAVVLCCYAVVARSSLQTVAGVNLEIVDDPSAPLLSAKVSEEKNELMISGEAHKRGDSSFNGYVSISAIAPNGQPIWTRHAELLTSGLRFFRYRVFENIEPSLPPPGSKIVIEFHKANSASAADVLSAPAQMVLIL